MQRYFIRLAFDGTAYCGWQVQPNGITVQQVVNKSLSTILKQAVCVHGSGRTDAGVHAREFFAHFDFFENLDPDKLDKLRYSLNGLLPPDIAVYDIFQVSSGAHARFSAVSRKYEYIISRHKNPFLINRAWFNKQSLQIELLQQGAHILLEYNEFGCFTKTHNQASNYRCNITQASWVTDNDLLIFSITANRFLRNMVRAIVGTLTEIGRGKISVAEFRKIIESGDRRLAGMSVPAAGLYLGSIVYPSEIYLFNS